MEERSAVYRLTVDEVQRMDSFRRTKHTAVLVVMFTDLQGSSAQVDMLERSAVDIIPELHRKFAEIIERDEGGRFIKEEGDATMAVFSEPSTAVERALEVQQYAYDRNRQRPGEPPILVRIGLHLGQVVVKDELATDALGSNVSIAWRVQSLAEGGHIYMTEAVFRDARRFLRRLPGLRWESYGRYRLAGFEEPEAICEVAIAALAGPKPPRGVSRVRSVRYTLEEVAPLRVWAIAVAFIAVAVVGGWLYLNIRGDGERGIEQVPPTLSLSFNLIGTYSTSRAANSVFVIGDIAYIANGGDGLLILDVSVPSKPKKIGQYPPETAVNNVTNVVVADNVAYVTERGGSQGGRVLRDKLVLLDVGIPSNPIKLGEYEHDTHRSLDKIAVVGNIAYLTASDELILLDVSTPSSPIKIGEFKFQSNIMNPGVAVVGSIAYIRSNDFYIIDVRKASEPVQIGQCDTSDWGAGLAMVDKLAYVVGWSGGLDIIDVSVPSQPTKLGQYKETGRYELIPPGAQGRHTMIRVSVAGNIAYVTYIFGIDHGTWTETLESGIIAIDVSDPHNPAKIGEYSELEETSSVFALGDLVFATDETRGLLIFSLGNLPQ